MSFTFSQSLLEDISSSSQINISQEETSSSQDSGYGFQSKVVPINVTTRPADFQYPFPPPRRSVANPTNWSNEEQFQPVENRWTFGSKKSWNRGGEPGTNALERDLQQLLTDMLGLVNKVPGKISTIVVESTKFLQNLSLYSKEGIAKEIDSISKDLEKLKEIVGNNIALGEDFKEKLECLESLLKEGFAAAEVVAEKNKALKAKLGSLMDKVAIADDVNAEIEGGLAAHKEKIKKINEKDFANVLVMELEVYNAKSQKTPLPSFMKMVPLKPSVRRLPTLSVIPCAAVTEDNSNKAEKLKGDGGEGQDEGDDMNLRKVRSSVRIVGRKRKAFHVEE